MSFFADKILDLLLGELDPTGVWLIAAPMK
jgi:hypothetical protein